MVPAFAFGGPRCSDRLSSFGKSSPALATFKPLVDQKYVAEETSAGAIVQYGLCIICVWDEIKTAAERMAGFNIELLKLHLKGHPNVLFEADQEAGSGRAFHKCGDPICVRFKVAQGVSLLEYVNHLIIEHWYHVKPVPAVMLRGKVKREGYAEPTLHIFADNDELTAYFTGKKEKRNADNAQKRVPGAKPGRGRAKSAVARQAAAEAEVDAELFGEQGPGCQQVHDGHDCEHARAHDLADEEPERDGQGQQAQPRGQPQGIHQVQAQPTLAKGPPPEPWTK